MSYQAAVNLGLTTAIVPESDPPRGYTDEEIVAILQTLTVHNIPVDSVRTWFREKELWLERSTGEMFGPLQVAYEQAPQEAKDGLDYLYDAVFKKSAAYLRTTEPYWAQKVYGLVQLILQLSQGSSGLVDSFYALDGGRPYKDLTEVQFAAQRTEYENLQAQQALAQEWGALQNTEDINAAVGAGDRDRLKAGLIAAAGKL